MRRAFRPITEVAKHALDLKRTDSLLWDLVLFEGDFAGLAGVDNNLLTSLAQSGRLEPLQLLFVGSKFALFPGVRLCRDRIE